MRESRNRDIEKGRSGQVSYVFADLPPSLAVRIK